MIALAAVIVVAGIAAFMLIRGGQGQPSAFAVSDKTGYANIERAGINYALDVGTALQDGDVVETLDGSEISVQGPKDTKLFLADASKMQVRTASSSPATIDLVSGSMFADAQSEDGSFAIAGSEHTWTASDGVFVSDVRKGALTVQVLSGTVTFDDGSTAQMGESRTYLSNQKQGSAQSQSAEASPSDAKAGAFKMANNGTSKLTLGSLDAFALEHALDAISSGRKLVFTEDQIKEEQERREVERRQLAEQAAAASKASGASKSASSASAKDPAQQSADSQSGKESSEATEGEAADWVEAGAGDAAMTSDGEGEQVEVVVDDTGAVANEDVGQNTVDEGDSSAVQGGQEEASVDGGQADDPAAGGVQSDVVHSCTIQIRCDTILANKDSLAEGKSKYVPKNGIILSSTAVEFAEGESAFDVLKRVCEEYGIALEYSYAPVYGSYYIEGIGNLYEFDCGDESGWMYKVNGWFPNYGCSEYPLSDGDAIEFCYTCNGLGEDVGA